jgi:hypothetical protein
VLGGGVKLCKDPDRASVSNTLGRNPGQSAHLADCYWLIPRQSREHIDYSMENDSIPEKIKKVV